MGIPKKWQHPILRNIWNYVYLKHGNIVIGITGAPNTGKSWTGAKICSSTLGPKYGVNDYLCYDVETIIAKTFAYIKYKGKPMTMEMVNHIENVDSWLEENKQYIKFKRGRALLFDEAGVGAYVRDFFSKDNKVFAKLLQLWRFLEMVVVVVVPGDMSMADKTIGRFLNMEILMLSVDIPKGVALGVAYETIGWNKKKNEPVRRRIHGCRNGGFIYITTLSPEQAKDYNNAMWHSKFGTMIKLAKEYKIQETINIGKMKTIQDDIRYVKARPELFKNRSGHWDWYIIKDALGISTVKAKTITKLIAKTGSQEDMNTGSQEDMKV